MVRVLGGLLAVLSAVLSARASDWAPGAGINVVTAHVVRGDKRNGLSLQPAFWFNAFQERGLFTSWASVAPADPALDDLVLDFRAGVPTAGWGWMGGVVHWDWSRPPSDSLRSHSLEIGPTLTWFKPPYRPSLTVTYDFAQRNGVLFTVNAPYTVRMTWLPATTFIPEVAFRFAGAGNRVSAEYFSFSALLERKIRGVTLLPTAGIVPRSELSKSLVWAGIHVNVVR